MRVYNLFIRWTPSGKSLSARSSYSRDRGLPKNRPWTSRARAEGETPLALPPRGPSLRSFGIGVLNRGKHHVLDRFYLEVWAPKLLNGHDQEIHVGIGHDGGYSILTGKKGQPPEERTRPKSVSSTPWHHTVAVPFITMKNLPPRWWERQDAARFDVEVASQRIDPTKVTYRTGGERGNALSVRHASCCSIF